MPINPETLARFKDYDGLQLHESPQGFIAWQTTTGENVEIVFIETYEKREGYGTELIRLMCERIQPYHSVIVFRKAKNKAAGKFYRSLGFKETPIKGIYNGECAVLGVVSYKELLKNING